MDQTEIIIIGAGIIGLAILERLSKTHKDILLVEQETTFGQHTSSRNSEVIHSGIYYKPGSLKAKLCISGQKKLYQFLKDEKLTYSNCQKIIIASNEDEIPSLHKLYQNGLQNNVKGLKLINQKEIAQLEPQIKAVQGIWVPTTCICDVHQLMKRLLFKAQQNGAIVAFSTKVRGITKKKDHYHLTFSDGYKIQAKTVINAAGLFSDKVAQMAGFDIAKLSYKLNLCKGEYYKSSKIKGIKHLIYPIPDPKGLFLGIHTRLHLDGSISFGPNAYYVDEINYNMDNTYQKEFFKAISKYLTINKEDLTPDYTGIRPKLQGLNQPEKDFLIRNESDLGYPNFINLIGIESPGLTASLAIAKYVQTILD